MRSKTQERIEELARERTVACCDEAIGEGGAAIDLTLVEEGIEIGKKMMAEMIATYSASPSPARESAFPSAAVPDAVDPQNGATPAPAQEARRVAATSTR